MVTAVSTAPIVPRFIRSVGRSMILADQQLNGGANRDAINAAFQGHGILLGANAMVSPSMALDGPAVKKAAIHASTRKDLLRRIGAPSGARLTVAPANMFGTPVTRVVHEREVPLGTVHKKLAGVVAVAPESVTLGSMGARAAVMGAMPEPFATEDEVQSFVRSLIEHDRIDFEGKRDAANLPGPHTHAVRKVGRKKVLARLRFLCRAPFGGAGFSLRGTSVPLVKAAGRRQSVY
jgi:hypothetical protein